MVNTMNLRTILIGLSIGLLGVVGLTTVSIYESPAYATTSTTVKKYQATITTKDDRNNTKTFTDYCDASSNSEATTIFKARYPKATVSGVRETK